MVGRCDDEKTVIPDDAIELVKEERAIPIVDQAVEILEDKNAR